MTMATTRRTVGIKFRAPRNLHAEQRRGDERPMRRTPAFEESLRQRRLPPRVARRRQSAADEHAGTAVQSSGHHLWARSPANPSGDDQVARACLRPHRALLLPSALAARRALDDRPPPGSNLSIIGEKF